MAEKPENTRMQTQSAFKADLSTGSWLHVCVDMQNMFLMDTSWHTPWMARILDVVARICGRHPSKTVYTRFLPAQNSECAEGAWRDVYDASSDMTLDRLDPDMIELVSSLRAYAQTTCVFDKTTFSPWWDVAFRNYVEGFGAQTLVLTGGETDVCVLATAIGAIDLGFRVILVKDGICSSADETHDIGVKLFHDRFSRQVTLMGSDEILALTTP